MTTLSGQAMAVDTAEPVVRVVDGELDNDVLAALTALLFARAAAAAGPVLPRQPARWRRQDRAVRYLSPVSWR